VIDTGLKDKVVLITGANGGIGAATALALAAQGAKLFIAYLGEPSAEPLVREIERLTKASAFECDLSDASAPTRLFDRAEETFGRVDILINNAAHCIGDTFVPADDARDWGGRPTMFIDASSIDRHFAVNVRAAALLVAEFSRRPGARGAKWGRIISITTGGADCFPGEVSYGASKNALESYTRAAGKELARFGVTANLIVPGATQTGWITPTLEKIILPDVPAGRIGQPGDIADAIVLLASDQANWINCATVFVDGGQGRSN
jgi:3-oxoacyl-[acyl-carrier protein] reductase